MLSQTLAVDFGTSNSAAALLDGGAVRPVPLEDGAPTLPTAVFFPADGGPMQIGAAAGAALTGGIEGRYMRALKSVLGTPLFHEERLIGGRRRTLAEIVTAFLAEVKHRAEARTGRSLRHAVAGRPVHFHSADAARDAKAADDLAACYRAAGFEGLRFVLEPEAAALASAGPGVPGALGMIVDIGGGTSDFTLFRHGGPGAALEIIASHGIRLGGTDFDRALSLAHAMPLLGQGGSLRRDFGPGALPVPNAIYADLATWARIPFLYTGETRRAVAEMQKRALDPEAMARLAACIEHELGHELAFAVEAGKIAANGGAGDAAIRMEMIAPGLAAPLSPAALDATLAEQTGGLVEAMAAALAQAGVGGNDVGTVVLVGGSSLMALVGRAALQVCPGARVARAEAFTAVVDGLALAIGQEIGTPVHAA
ncbi:Hsp70 family protein [Sinisalibacter aestuarii]|uniref:Hsp70 family protein n=1 Tax=Sinisalibacter aestuarii TaxID=2949426 RepID=UPI00249314D8|nr:Hsp70 family protein [Sinisalibacter aestuarii]